MLGLNMYAVHVMLPLRGVIAERATLHVPQQHCTAPHLLDSSLCTS